MSEYNLTHVYWSEDFMGFPKGNFGITLDMNAAEVVQIGNGDWYISNTGWGKKGIVFSKINMG